MMAIRVLRNARIWLGFAISCIAVVLLLQSIEWGRLWDTLAGAEYRWLILSLLALVVEFCLRVLRWKMLLAPAKSISFLSLLRCMAIGYMANGVLPGRLGELVRVFLLARVEGVSPVLVLASVAVDRVLDVVVLAIALALVLPTTQLPAWVGSTGAVIGGGGIALLAISLLLAYPPGRRALLAVLAALPSFPGKAALSSWMESLCLGVQGLKGAGAQGKMLIVSLLIWLASMMMFYCGQLAFHIDAPLSSAVLVTTMTSMGAVVPSSPGYVGVFHYLVVVAMGAYGVEREVALGFAVVIHLMLILPLGLLGAFSLSRLGMTLSNVGKIQRDDKLVA